MTMSVSAANPWATPGGMYTADVVLARQVEAVGGAIGRTALAQIVQDDTRRAERDVPVVALVEVIVQPDERALLAVRTVALDHLPGAGNPFATVGLDEQATLITVDGRLDDVHAGDLRRLCDGGHRCLLLDVDLTVVAHHQADGAGLAFRA